MESNDDINKLHRIEWIDKLLKRKDGMVEYLLLKADEQDWHGVADAAMDLREIETELQVLKEF